MGVSVAESTESVLQIDFIIQSRCHVKVLALGLHVGTSNIKCRKENRKDKEFRRQ